MAVWITQLLCPARHAITARADEADTEAEAVEKVEKPMRAMMRRWLRTKVINRHCAICGADAATWRYETARTVFKTMAEAEPGMRKLETENAVTNALFGDMDHTKPN